MTYLSGPDFRLVDRLFSQVQCILHINPLGPVTPELVEADQQAPAAKKRRPGRFRLDTSVSAETRGHRHRRWKHARGVHADFERYRTRLDPVS